MQKFSIYLLLAFGLSAQAPKDDPRLVFSTFHGGDRNDDANGVAVDANGFIYVTGETESRDLNATPVGGKPLTSAVFKGYLTKYAPGGKAILWRLLIGGSSNTVPRAIALDAQGNVYVAGTTGARDLPLVKPVQSVQTGLNIAFLMKFDPEGKLQFSTYFGGERNEEGQALAIDSQGNIYLAGRATSTKLPVKNALQPALAGGGQDAFIAKFTADYQLAYATYFGGISGTDNVSAIAIGPDDSLYLTGENMSPALSTENAYIKLPVSYSSYLAKISPEGDKVSYFTYLGWRAGYTKAQALAVDGAGRAYVGGNTTSKQIPTTENAIQKEYAGGMRDGFLLRMNAEGSALEYLTYLGGSFSGPYDPDETINALKVDHHGHVYVAGLTNSKDFPGQQRSLQPEYGGDYDAYLLRFDPDGQRIIYSSFWGGGKRDVAVAIALGPGENATVVGESFSSDLPLSTAAVQTKLGSLNDAFVSQICDPWPYASIGGTIGLSYVRGGKLPEVDLEALSGCSVKFEATGPEADATWLTVASDALSLPMKLKFSINPEGLEPGEYPAKVRITVPAAYEKVLELPVVLTVTDPPPPAETARIR